MGNASSQPDRTAAPRPSRTRSILHSAARRRPADLENDHESDPHSSQHTRGQINSNASSNPSPPTNSAQPSISRLARFTHSHPRSPPWQDVQEQARHDLLHRARGSFRVLMNRSGSVRRRAQPNTDPTSRAHAMLSSLAEQSRAGSSREGGNHYAPRLPSIDTSGFGADQISFSDEIEPSPPPQSAHSHRRSNLRFNPLRQLARRRSPQAHDALRRTAAEHPGEDQAAMLSRLLSVAAAATAATLMGDDAQAYGEAGTLSGGAGMGDLSSNGEDGSFDGFLRALQNGRIASALREGADNNNSSREGPLNFFRMFRFGSSTASPDARASPHQDDDRPDSEAAEGRMVPIIIVGIRSISPSSGSESASPSEELPPFMDPLGNFSNPLPTNALGPHGHESIDSMLSPPRNGTSFRHRRRASMGGFGMSRNRLGERHEEQRDQTSPDRRRERPWSMASSSSHLEPRPPPATPASPSPELSRIPSASSTPGHSRPPSFIANSMRESPGVSRRNSILPRPTAALTAHTEETVAGSTSESSENLLGSQRESNTFGLNPHRRSDTIPHVHYPRFASGHPRRNGVVEPDHLPPLSRASTSHGTESTANNGEQRSNGDSRSWIIYVLGGSYPENHPILTTPSLFTENPTYEDMMLLSALLGPAKAPVASDEEVEAAGGLYSIVLADAAAGADVEKTRQLVAVATDSEERVELEVGQRCLVCLCDFEPNESGRKLVKCNHLFHKDCIDQWLTQGRNSCPLCRGQGVDQKSSTGASSPSEEASPPEWATESPAVVEAEASG